MLDIRDPEPYLTDMGNRMAYVGFMKARDTWFPLALIRPEGRASRLDTLLLSDSLPAMNEALETFARGIPEVTETFVQYLMAEEIRNLLERYGLTGLAVLSNEAAGGCGCGCGCS